MIYFHLFIAIMMGLLCICWDFKDGLNIFVKTTMLVTSVYHTVQVLQLIGYVIKASL
jgi:hypothetical protein